MIASGHKIYGHFDMRRSAAAQLVQRDGPVIGGRTAGNAIARQRVYDVGRGWRSLRCQPQNGRQN